MQKKWDTLNELQGKDGIGFFMFQGIDLPDYLAEFGGSIIIFYVGVVYVFSTIFRSAMVPLTNEIFITDAPLTEKILNIC
jgi:hypothetical protein